MTEFEKVLEQWNGGIFRGAKVKLSKEIDVSEVTVSRWAKGELKPGSVVIIKISPLNAGFLVVKDLLKFYLKYKICKPVGKAGRAACKMPH